MSRDPENDVEFLARRIDNSLEELGDKIVEAMRVLARAHGGQADMRPFSLSVWNLDELKTQLAPSDQLLLARALCEGSPFQVVNR